MARRFAALYVAQHALCRIDAVTTQLSMCEVCKPCSDTVALHACRHGPVHMSQRVGVAIRNSISSALRGHRLLEVVLGSHCALDCLCWLCALTNVSTITHPDAHGIQNPGLGP